MKDMLQRKHEQELKLLDLFQAVYTANRQVEAVEKQFKVPSVNWEKREKLEATLLEKIGLSV